MELKAQKREVLGKKVGALRREGLIPAELYGHGVENVHLAVAAKDFGKVYAEAGENTVVNLSFNGAPRMVMIHGVQTDPVKSQVISVDFHEVKMDEAITAAVPLEFVGESPAVKDLGGVLVKAMDEIEVEAFPQDIPSEIIIDLSKLANLGDSVYVKDLPTGAKYEYKVDPTTVVVTVSEPAEEEVSAAEITPESVIVEGEEKRAQREANAQNEGNEA
jgi:large subunit ribosomal protein L25